MSTARPDACYGCCSTCRVDGCAGNIWAARWRRSSCTAHGLALLLVPTFFADPPVCIILGIGAVGARVVCCMWVAGMHNIPTKGGRPQLGTDGCLLRRCFCAMGEERVLFLAFYAAVVCVLNMWHQNGCRCSSGMQNHHNQQDGWAATRHIPADMCYTVCGLQSAATAFLGGTRPQSLARARGRVRGWASLPLGPSLGGFFVRFCLPVVPRLAARGYVSCGTTTKAARQWVLVLTHMCRPTPRPLPCPGSLQRNISMIPLSSGCLALICTRAGADTNTLLRHTYCQTLSLACRKCQRLWGWRLESTKLLVVQEDAVSPAVCVPCPVCVVVCPVCVLVLRACGSGRGRTSGGRNAIHVSARCAAQNTREGAGHA